MSSSNSSIVYLLPSSASITLVNNFNNHPYDLSSSLLLLTYDYNNNYNNRDPNSSNNHSPSSLLSACRIIVPYISRHVCPLMFIYLLEENDDHDDVFVGNRDDIDNNDNINEHEQEQQHPLRNQDHVHNNIDRRRLRFVSVTLTSSYYSNTTRIMEQQYQQHFQQQQHCEQERNKNRIIINDKNHSHNVSIHHHNCNRPMGKYKLYKLYDIIQKNNKNNIANNNHPYQPIHKVLLHIPNLLSYILSYLTPQDILQTTSCVNKTFYECSRKDSLWKNLCIQKWRDKLNVPRLRRRTGRKYHNYFGNFYNRREEDDDNETRNQNNNKRRKRNNYYDKYDYDIGLFWNTLIDPILIHGDNNNYGVTGVDDRSGGGLSVHEMKLTLIDRPSLGRNEYRSRLYSCIEKHDLIKLILDCMPDCLGYNKQDDVGDDEDVIGEEETAVRMTTGDDKNKEKQQSTTETRKIEKNPILATGFHHLWFGSYASSIIDSKRITMTLDELVSLNGFSLNFKVVISLNNSANSRSTTRTNNYESSSSGSTMPTASTTSSLDGTNHNQHHSFRNNEENIQLHYHGMCYFYEDHRFQTEPENEDTRNQTHQHQGLGQEAQFHQNALNWKWIKVGRILQIERYPPLFITRMKNWGWKLENTQVVLLSH